MGVSGCGKSTLGRLLADRLGVNFVEGDSLHSDRNVAKMAAGTPLTDADRHGWLQAVAEQLNNPTAQASGVVASCSALKRIYRDLLRAGAPDLRFVFLHGDPALLAQRLGGRSGHYMPASLLQSQLDTLEPPGDDESPIRLDIALAPELQVQRTLDALEASS
ncbi:MAG: gluconokinase [Burkholderiaceae bacterium]|nr:gluconokinase [Rhodoferax sp.]MCP5285230.1 gluconokinase [Burkholderiaceae bacterium]